jgi:hypothetical protein
MNRIRAGEDNPDPNVDGILFYTDQKNWPETLYRKFTDPFVPARFDSALAANYNIGFLFASGPFSLKAGKRERFSLALAFGADLDELRDNVRTVQQIYNANYQFAVPPKQPTLTAEAGDRYVRLSWDDVAERSVDPVSSEVDFEGYRIYRSTDPDFLDPQVISTGTGSGPQPGNGRPITQFDLVDGKKGFSRRTVNGVAYWLGSDTGITHTWTDTTVVNGQEYFYAVAAYDFGYEPIPGSDSLGFYPSENAIPVSRTLRGGLILPPNAVAVRPNPKVAGFTAAKVDTALKVAGDGTGTVAVQVVNSTEVPEGHLFEVTFATPAPESIRASTYALRDSTMQTTLFSKGRDFEGAGTGPVGAGLLPLVTTPLYTTVDAGRSGFTLGSPTDAKLLTIPIGVLDRNLRRPGYPDDFAIVFDDIVRDTAVVIPPVRDSLAKFYVVAHTDTGDLRLRFRFRDTDKDGTLSTAADLIDVLTEANARFDSLITWRVQIDTTGGRPLPTRVPGAGDVYEARLSRPVGDSDVFVFTTHAERIDARAVAQADPEPYVVPNPYVGAASFEPAPFAISGRGERRIEFRNIPFSGVIRIYTVRGDLVQTLRQGGSTEGFVPWNLRTKDNLDVAPGLYIYNVESPTGSSKTGKFAIVK